MGTASQHVKHDNKILPYLFQPISSKLSKRRQSSEMLQLTFKNLPKSAGIEGGTLRAQKKISGPKSLFFG